MKSGRAKIAGMLLAGAFIAAASAADAADAVGEAQEIFPACQDSKGKDVIYRVVDGRTQGFYIGNSILENGKPVILVDQNAMQEIPKAMPFFMEHECAHHKLGHLYELENMTRRPTDGLYHRMENDADCEAARQTKKKYGYGAAEITAVFSAFSSAGDSTHPPKEQRLTRALWCIGIIHPEKGPANPAAAPR